MTNSFCSFKIRPFQRVLCLLCGLMLAPNLRAQQSGNPAMVSDSPLEAKQEPTGLDGQEETASDARQGAEAISYTSEQASSISDSASQDAVAMAFLRETEVRAAIGQRLPLEQIAQIHRMTREDFGVRVRQKALTLLPWFPSEESFRAVRENLSAPEDSLRVESMAALQLMYHRLPEASLPVVRDLARTGLWDANDDVACRAASLSRQVASAAPDFRTDSMQRKLREISTVRFACFAENFLLPPRQPEETKTEDIAVEQQETKPLGAPNPSEKAKPSDPNHEKNRFLPGRTGNGLVYAAAIGGGAVVGGLLPALVVPAEERLAYSSLRSRYQRTEASIWVSSAAALGGAALAGAGVWALQTVQPEMTPAQGMGVTLGTWSGALSGLGVVLATGSQGQMATVTVTSGLVLGMASSMAAQYWMPPTWQDSLSTAMLSSQVALLGTLTSLALVPPSASAVLGATRLDFALGTGFLVGGASTLLSQWILPMAKPAYPRLWAAGLVSSLGAATGLWIGNLPWTAGFGSGTQWGCVFGAGMQLASGLLAYYLLPPAWAKWLTPKALHPEAASPPQAAELTRQILPTLRREQVGARSIVFLDFVDFRF